MELKEGQDFAYFNRRINKKMCERTDPLAESIRFASMFLCIAVYTYK